MVISVLALSWNFVSVYWRLAGSEDWRWLRQGTCLSPTWRCGCRLTSVRDFPFAIACRVGLRLQHRV